MQPSQDWTVAQLRDHAAAAGIDLAGLRLKADILAAVLEADRRGTVLTATDSSIDRAVSAGILSAQLQAGPIAAMRVLASKIDGYDEYMTALRADHEARGLRPPSQDNVSISAYLKYCQALGLLPGTTVGAAGRGATEPKSEPAESPKPTEQPAEPESKPVDGGAQVVTMSKLRAKHQAG